MSKKIKMKRKLLIINSLLLLFCGCSTRYYEKSADKEVNRILKEKKEKIEREIPAEFLNDNTSSETIILTLKKSLILGAKNNKEYKSRKEDVYLKILDLTYQRYLYRLRYGMGGNIYWKKNGDERLEGEMNFTLIKFLKTGAQVTFNIAEDFLKYLTGNKEKDLKTILSLNIFQPLFKGAGRKIAQEQLIQAERDVVYEIRDFLRYQEDFSIQVAEKFFNLLLLKKNVENYWNNYNFLKKTRERIEMLSAAGRIPPLQVDQARQNEYRAYQMWLTALNNYNSSLDEFKILLGLSPSAKISVKSEELNTFLKEGVPPIKINLDEFLKIALKKRLDLMTAFDKIEDAKRKVVVARNNLKTELNLNVNVEDEVNKLGKLSYEVGFDFEFPVDKISERNEYKRRLIELEREKRNFELKKDRIKQEVYDSYRNLQEAYDRYIIEKESLSLAERRVESVNLLLQAGRATTRDLLEAQEAYLFAKNSLVSAVVKYLVSYLKFLRSADLIEIDENGIWKGDLYEKINFIIKE